MKPVPQVAGTFFELFGVAHYKRKIQKHRLLTYSYRMARPNGYVLRNFDLQQIVHKFVIFRRQRQLALQRSRITI